MYGKNFKDWTISNQAPNVYSRITMEKAQRLDGGGFETY